jgi:hypothetical protein
VPLSPAEAERYADVIRDKDKRIQLQVTAIDRLLSLLSKEQLRATPAPILFVFDPGEAEYVMRVSGVKEVKDDGTIVFTTEDAT